MLHDTRGATAIEYGLIAALIALAAVASITSVGEEMNSDFEKVETSYAGANGGG